MITITILLNRYQRVAIKRDGLSEKQDLAFGLPQGVHAYAHDTQLYLSFRPDGSTNEKEAWNAMERRIRAVRAWMIMDKLKLNEFKTEFMLFGTRQQLSKINRNTLLIGSNRFESMTEARNLGVLFESILIFVTILYY